MAPGANEFGLLRRLLGRLASFVSVCVPMAALSPALAAPLSGTIMYEVSLDPSSSMPGLTGAEGIRTTQASVVCGRITVVDIFSITLLAGEEEIGWTALSKITEGAKELEFEAIAGIDEQTDFNFSGTARKTATGISMSLVEPAKKSIGVEGDILFPHAFREALVELARSGISERDFRLFSGTSVGEARDSPIVTDVTVHILPALPPDEDEKTAAAALGIGPEMGRWRFKIDFHGGEPEKSAGVITDSILYENGFEARGVARFGPLALAYKPVEFRPSAAKRCGGKSQ